MCRKVLQILVLGLIAGLILPGLVMATPIVLTSAVDGLQSYKYKNVWNGINMKVKSQRKGQKMTWDSSDGGVGIGDDEITGGYTGWWNRETLRITFSAPIFIESFSVVDLFPTEKFTYTTPQGEQVDTVGELGYYKVKLPNHSSFSNLTMFGPGDTHGDLTVPLGMTVKAINFFAVNSKVSDYALKSLEAVPEPGTMLLLGLGLLGLGCYGRRRKRM